jgi:outer membrane protein OmpA-like peptidoglycan-associated protein
MADSLLDSITSHITPDLLSKAASVFGDDQGGVTRGLSAAVPMLLGGTAKRASDPSFASSLFKLVSDPANDASVIDNPARLLESGAGSSGIGALGGSLLSSLFGGNQGMASNALSRFAGVKPSTAASLLKFGAPLVMSCLGRAVKKGGLNASSLAGLLGQQKDQFKAAMPSSMPDLDSMLDTGREQVGAAVPERKSSIWRWLIPLIVVLGALWFLSEMRGRDADVEPVPQPAPATEPATEPAASPPEDTTRSLNATPSVDVYFDEGSATLPDDSSSTLASVVEYMLANPTAEASISGYHDTSGESAANEALAQDRAEAVRDALVAAGVDKNQLSLDRLVFTVAGIDDDARRVEVKVR